MKRAVITTTITALVASGGAAVIATAAPSAGSSWTGLRAGVGVVDASWHLGGSAGQYGTNAYDGAPDPSSYEWDPNVQHVKKQSADGMASRLSIRAIVLQDGKGDAPIALVKVDNYLAQDMLTRRVAQILQADGSGVTYDNILMSATHDHNSPYYSSPAGGVWLFQDVMDLREYEYQARQMAAAIEQAEHTMVPARVGATTVQFANFQGNIAGQDLDAQGAPAGYPVGDNDHGLTLMRFDNVSDPAHPKPLATYVNYAQHGESLDGYDIYSADWLAPFERFMQQGTGVPVVFSQGSVGSSEGPYDNRYPRDKTPTESDQGDTVYKIFAHTGFAQAERGTHVLAEQALAAWQAIGGAHNGVAVQSPYQTDPTVKMLTHWVAGPLSHPYPSVGNCRTNQTLGGDPGVPAAGLPDCGRSSDNLGFTLPLDPTLADQIKGMGIPLPDNYDATSFGTVEENLRIKLQAVRIGDILLASCSCEAQSDLIKNLESRTDNIALPYDKDHPAGNQWLGFDYANQADVNEGFPDAPQPVAACHPVDPTDLSKGYDCPDPTKDWLFGQVRVHVSQPAFDHMEAEINNDANGWNDPSYVAQAGSEPTTPADIKGNFTHMELGANHDGYDYTKCKDEKGNTGFNVTIGLGHTGDYDGYTVSYREYEARDAYRKALTTYGPHTADYMVTNLVGMAANLLCGTPLIAQPTDPMATADEQRQQAEATALGQITSELYDGWTAQIPDSAGPAAVTHQPWDVQRFDATQVEWVGGDNWTDNPVVVVQRQGQHGQWQDFTDPNGFGGEVQTFIEKPADMLSSMPTYRSGTQQWKWRASFEVFDSYPRADVVGGQIPNGTYRFVINGHIHNCTGSDKCDGGVAPYRLESAPFTVSPWTGIKVSDLKRDNSGQVSFAVDPIAYPKMPPAQHRQGIDEMYKDDSAGNTFCHSCTFRPWATTGSVASAVVQITTSSRHGHGTSHPVTVTASYNAATGRWVANVPVGTGQTVTVPAGGVRDTYGETNADGVSFTE